MKRGDSSAAEREAPGLETLVSNPAPRSITRPRADGLQSGDARDRADAGSGARPEQKIERIYYGEPGGMVSWRYPGSPQHHLLPRRTDLANHSPTGFSWGFGGSGPAQLALALLAHALASPRADGLAAGIGERQQQAADERALRLYQLFKFRAVANLPSRWTMTRSRILAYAAELERAGAGSDVGGAATEA